MVLWNSASNICVKGAIERGVKILTKTKTNWLTITMVFHFVLQFCRHVRMLSEMPKFSIEYQLTSGSSALSVGLGTSTSSCDDAKSSPVCLYMYNTSVPGMFVSLSRQLMMPTLRNGL